MTSPLPSRASTTASTVSSGEGRRVQKTSEPAAARPGATALTCGADRGRCSAQWPSTSSWPALPGAAEPPAPTRWYGPATPGGYLIPRSMRSKQPGSTTWWQSIPAAWVSYGNSGLANHRLLARHTTRGTTADAASQDGSTMMTSSVRGPCTPSTRSNSMSTVADGPLIQVCGRSGRNRAIASGRRATTWLARTMHRR